MKATKALKHLTKIEALMSDLMDRFSPSAPAVRESLQNAKTAVTRAKQAVSSQQAASGTAKKHPAKDSKPASTGTPDLPTKKAVAPTKKASKTAGKPVKAP